ncbi:fibronectin type III domain-containing protein [Dactylosporangium sp. NPDC051541]|uniref:fibronectin type III domain-containing protein n=1 Tax=Dactylosporangium sp. NPDC051541 TaxID=3363977 RepID=UPI0037AC3B90
MQSNPYRPTLVAAATAVALALAPPALASASASAAPPSWSLAGSATVGADSSFKAVAAVAADDAWAVGATNLFGTGPQQTLAEHWDGARWSTVPTPNAVLSNTTGNSNVLNAAAAVSARDVWAVGYTSANGFSYSGSLTEHWDGTAWKVIPSPNGVLPSFNFYNILLGVAGRAADDVWAVGWNGYLFGPDLHRPAIQRWNGSSWSLSTVPPIGDNAQNVVVTAVTARTADDAWATGYYSNDDQGLVTHPFALHFNGTAWTRADPVDVVRGGSVNRVNLTAVKALAADDVWAAGNVLYTDAQGAGQSQAIVQHWNGTAWSVVPGPSSDATSTTLTGLAVLAPDDVWAAGTTAASAAGGARDPLLEHWDGHTWTAVAAPRPGTSYNCGFFGAAAAGGRAHAVGACTAADAATQPLAIPIAATTPAVTGGGTAPAAPTGLAATAVSRSQARLTWQDNATDETGYRIERCQGVGCTAFAPVANTGAGATTFTDTGLARNTSYTYRVRAFNAGGPSAYSGAVTVRTPRT